MSFYEVRDHERCAFESGTAGAKRRQPKAALELALKDAKKRKCEKFVFLGDTTGYGYDVKTTLKLVKDNFDVIIMGNLDSICAGLNRGCIVCEESDVSKCRDRFVLSRHFLRLWQRDRR